MIKNVNGFDGYHVSDTGQVFSSKRNQWRELKLQTNVDGYNVVNLYRDGKYHHCRVARLVAEAFIPNPQGLPVVNHIDHSRTNDNVTNLEWCTEAENSQASIKLHPERWKARANISYQEAEKICQMISEGARNKEIVSALGVTSDTVKKIRQGVAWVEVSSNYTMRPSHRGISEETVRWVCNKIVEGLKNSEILAQTTSKNLTPAMVKRIRSKDSWSRISNEYF